MLSAIITFDPQSPQSALRQISDQLRALLVEGQFEPGVTLPPVRRLAADLGLHFNTVAEAYRGLAGEGWLEIIHGKGATVRCRDQPIYPQDSALAAAFRQRLRHVIAEERSKGLHIDQIERELTRFAIALGGSNK